MKKWAIVGMLSMFSAMQFAYADMASVTDGVDIVGAEEGTTWQEFFRETEGSLIDFAFLSAHEFGYFRDNINGQTYTGYQTPLFYATPYVTCDFGYVTIPNDVNAFAIGGTIRLERLIADALDGRLSWVQNNVPGYSRYSDKLWVGPWLGGRFFSDRSVGGDNKKIMGGIKAGLRF